MKSGIGPSVFKRLKNPFELMGEMSVVKIKTFPRMLHIFKGFL